MAEYLQRFFSSCGVCVFSIIVYALMYFHAKCLLKVIFLFIPIWNIVVMKKRDCIFFSLNL